MKSNIIIERSTSAPPPGLIDPVRVIIYKQWKFFSYIMKEMFNRMRLQLQSNTMNIIIH